MAITVKHEFFDIFANNSGPRQNFQTKLGVHITSVIGYIRTKNLLIWSRNKKVTEI